MAEPTFVIATFKDMFHPQVLEHMDLSWRDLVHYLATPRQIREKRACPQWAPAWFRPERRRNANVRGVSCLVYDFDDGTSLDTIMARAAPWTRLTYTTWSHSPVSHRFRLVMPLERLLTPEEYPIVWRYMHEKLGMTSDTACKDVGRAWLCPAERPEFRVQVAGAVLFGADAVPVEFSERMAKATRVPSIEDRLNTLPPDMRDMIIKRLAPTLGLPTQRAALAARVGAATGNEHARGGLCPQCGRQSVWWHLRPLYDYRARCSHKNSCGWEGSLVDVALAADALVEDLQSLD